MMQIESLPSIMSTKRELEDFTCIAEDLSMPKTKVKHLQPENGKPKIINNTNYTNGKGDIYSNDYFYNNQSVKRSFSMPETTFTEIMDIQEPLANLKIMLEQRLNVNLNSYQTWLQDKVKMQSTISLSDQCIKSAGLAQIKVELKQVDGVGRINILDVLRLAGDEERELDGDSSMEFNGQEEENEITSVQDLSKKCATKQEVANCNNNNNVNEAAHWVISDANSVFSSPFPRDLSSWSENQVQLWLNWAIDKFHIKLMDPALRSISAKELCQMTAKEFQKKVPADPHNLFWTHIDLLRKCKIFAVPELAVSTPLSPVSLTQTKPSLSPFARKKRASSSSNGSTKRPTLGHNGQIQLWQFLLELLGDRSKKSVIQWVGRNGEFKLNDPELVAQMWGERKNKPRMNYEKLSRALRYYYSESMIAKVHGRRFVYKFVCNLKELIGYDTEELISMVEDDPPNLEEC